jgi:hypothetical protein
MSDDIRKMIDKVKNFNNVVDSGVRFVYAKHPELNNIGTPQQYSEYLKTIFPNSKVKGIVYHGSNNYFDKFDKQYIGKNDAVSGYGFYFSHFIESARIFGKPVAALINLKRPSKKSLGYNELIDKESYEDLPLELRDEYKLIKDGKYKGYYEINLDVNRVPNESWDDFTLRLSKAAYDNVKKKYDGVYFGEKAEDIDDDRDIVVFEPEDIHMLGSKKDFEGFENFMKNKLDFE